jgi:hypothetical protein
MLLKMANSQQVSMLGTTPCSPIHVTILDCSDFFVTVKGDLWDKSRTISWQSIEIGRGQERNLPELLEYDR